MVSNATLKLNSIWGEWISHKNGLKRKKIAILTYDLQ